MGRCFLGNMCTPSAKTAYPGRSFIVPPGISSQNWKLVGSLKGVQSYAEVEEKWLFQQLLL